MTQVILYSTVVCSCYTRVHIKCIRVARLQLPGEVTEMGASNAVYDADDGKFILTVEKVNRGEYFPNLDLISTLLVKKTKKFPSKPNIRVLGKDIISLHVAQKFMM